MTSNKNQAYKFSAGEKVAYYWFEVIMVGEVVTAEDNKVTITVTGEDRFEFTFRESDGLFIADECVSQRIPTKMVAPLSQTEAINKWRYPTSPLQKLKQMVMLLKSLLPFKHK